MNSLKKLLKTSAQSLLSKDLYSKGRHLLHELKPLPDFLIIGTQKGGTTSLYNYLTSHPKIHRAAKKETYFFDYNYSKGIRWYRRHFPLLCRIKPNALTGEASPGYLYFPYVARRIASVITDIKLIVLLRNPVDRAISQYWHEVEGGWENLPMAEAFEEEKERLKKGEEKIQSSKKDYSFEHIHYSYLDRGKYAKQLKTYFNHFDRDQIHILKSEEFFNNTRPFFKRTANFLGLEAHHISSFEPTNVGSYRQKTNLKLRKELKEYFRPYNKNLYELLERNLEWQ